MSDQSFNMWEHWRGNYGYAITLEDYYPDLLAINTDLQQAVAAINNAERAIDKIMDELNLNA